MHKKCIMHFVLLFRTQSRVFAAAKDGFLLCHLYLTPYTRVFCMESSRTDEKIVTNSDVHKYFSQTSYTYTPVWCRINEREENLLIVCTRECTCETYKRVCLSDGRYISSINECGWFYFFFHHTYTGKKFFSS